jgi:hypothetical protein
MARRQLLNFKHLDDLCEGMSCGHETRASKIIV